MRQRWGRKLPITNSPGVPVHVSLGRKPLRNPLIVCCFTNQIVLRWSVYGSNFPHQVISFSRTGPVPFCPSTPKSSRSPGTQEVFGWAHQIWKLTHKIYPIPIGIVSCLGCVLLMRVTESPYLINMGNNTKSWKGCYSDGAEKYPNAFCNIHKARTQLWISAVPQICKAMLRNICLKMISM